MKYKDEYDMQLNTSNTEVQIGRLVYSPAEILRVIDPMAYDVGYSEWLESQGLVDNTKAEDKIYEFRN